MAAASCARARPGELPEGRHRPNGERRGTRCRKQLSAPCLTRRRLPCLSRGRRDGTRRQPSATASDEPARASIELVHTPQCIRSATRPRSSGQLPQLATRVRPARRLFSERRVAWSHHHTTSESYRVGHPEILAHRQAPVGHPAAVQADEPCWPATRQPLLSGWASPW